MSIQIINVASNISLSVSNSGNIYQLNNPDANSTITLPLPSNGFNSTFIGNNSSNYTYNFTTQSGVIIKYTSPDIGASATITATGSSVSITGMIGNEYYLSSDGYNYFLFEVTLSTTGITPGTYGDATNVPQIMFDANGRAIAVNNIPIAFPTTSISVTGTDITMSGNTGTAITNATLNPTGVTAGTYNNSNVSVTPFTIDAKGRITSTGTPVTITPSWSSITSKPTTLSGYGITDAAPISYPTFTGTVTIPTLSVTGNSTLSSTTISGTLSLQQTLELANISNTTASGTITFNLLSGAILYYTSPATGNWTLNITGNSTTTLNSVMSIGQSTTLVFLNTNGSNAYYQTGLQIDGTTITPKWLSGMTASGNSNAIDVYSITIIKTSNATYTVLESQTTFS